MIEPLDFCRVKKIDEKGFGFLKSLYYPGDIFFHFSQIKKEEFVEKLNDMKRGDFFLFYTSYSRPDGKRKVQNVWYDLSSVAQELITDFSGRIVSEFETGRTNLYDLFHVFSGLRSMNAITEEQLLKILSSPRIISLPTTILPYLAETEIQTLKNILKYDELKDKESKPFWYDDFVEKR